MKEQQQVCYGSHRSSETPRITVEVRGRGISSYFFMFSYNLTLTSGSCLPRLCSHFILCLGHSIPED
jgi:hypothetical protein